MTVTIIQGDVREKLAELPPDYFDCIVTSPPYWGLRDYGVSGQIGLEPTLDAYIETMVGVCRELWRVLKPSGTFWLNIGDSYCSTDKWGGGGGNTGKQTVTADGIVPSWAVRAKKEKQRGLKPKDLCMVPARLALALQADGWWLRSEIIWAKPNPMPESVTDRPTCAHEKIFLFTKSERYFFNAEAVREESVKGAAGSRFDTGKTAIHQLGRSSANDRGDRDGRNIRNVWSMASQPFKEAHFATFPPELVERCIKAGCQNGGHVLDPFGGAGTTGLVADRLGRDCTLIELNQNYVELARSRIANDAPLFAAAEAKAGKSEVAAL